MAETDRAYAKGDTLVNWIKQLENMGVTHCIPDIHRTSNQHYIISWSYFQLRQHIGRKQAHSKVQYTLNTPILPNSFITCINGIPLIMVYLPYFNPSSKELISNTPFVTSPRLEPSAWKRIRNNKQSKGKLKINSHLTAENEYDYRQIHICSIQRR